MTSQARRIAERRARARLLREQCLSVRAIALRLGVSKSTVAADLAGPVLERRPAPPNHAEPGNGRAVRHGAHSPELVEARARELAPQILGANGHLDAMRDGAAVARYAMALARVELVYRWLAEQGDPVFADVDAGVAHGIYERLERWERQADAAEDRLAIAPLTRARLGLDLLHARRSLEDELAEGRAVWARREAIDGESGEVTGEGA
jgi:hypothetical protein